MVYYNFNRWTFNLLFIAYRVTHITSCRSNTAPTPSPSLPRDCADLQTTGSTDQAVFYSVYRRSCADPLNCVVTVQCDFTTNGGGWTVIQQRTDNTETFDRTWSDYKAGFGILGSNFWIGNQYINELTQLTGNTYELMIQLTPTNTNNTAVNARYASMVVDTEANNYTLTLGTLTQSGASIDNLANSRNQPFGTRDRDTDRSTATCGVFYQSGWWFDSNCGTSGNLNIPYDPVTGSNQLTGIIWQSNSTTNVRMSATSMKVRPTIFNAG